MSKYRLLEHGASLNIRIPKELLEDFKELARIKGKRQGEYVRELLEKEIELQKYLKM